MGAASQKVGSLSKTADAALLSAIDALSNALNKLQAPSMVIGGLAVIVRGVPRLTQDIDATIWGPDIAIDALVECLKTHAISPRIDDADTFAKQHQVLLLIHNPSQMPIDLSLAWLPFEQEALSRATTENIGDVQIRVASAEDLIIFKAVAFRDRDRSDIERLVSRHHATVNLDRVRLLVEQFAEVLEDPDRVAALNKIIDRALDTESNIQR